MDYEHHHEHRHEHEHHEHHEHEHHHEHHHEHVSESDVIEIDKLVKMLGYMKDHNEHHAEEIVKLAQSARELGRKDVAELLNNASRFFEEGNSFLRDALKKLN